MVIENGGPIETNTLLDLPSATVLGPDGTATGGSLREFRWQGGSTAKGLVFRYYGTEARLRLTCEYVANRVMCCSPSSARAAH